VWTTPNLLTCCRRLFTGKMLGAGGGVVVLVMLQLGACSCAAAAARSPGSDGGDRRAIKADVSPVWNPLAGLPPLRVTHHSWPICRDGLQSGVQCQLPIDSNNPVLVDYARITGAIPLSVAYGCQWEAKQPWPLNATEIFEAVKICHLAGTAGKSAGTGSPGISLNYSPWFAYWNPHCKDHCDPTNVTGEAEEMSFYQGRLEEIKHLIDEANHLLTTTSINNATYGDSKGGPPPAVRVSALLLDSEKLQGWGASGRDNVTIKAAITRKHNLMYNASKAVFPDATVEQYDKGTIEDEKGMSKTGTSEAWAPWSVYTLDEQGDSFATSLYSVPEIGQTRQQYRLTVQNAVAHNVSSVTPWIALGSGYRRGITNTSLGSNYWDSAWDYGYEYSWILGAEINQPFYAKNPVKFAPWDYAKRAVFYPSVFEQAMTVPVVTPHGNSTLIFLHFLAYVRGAAGVPELPQWRPVPPQFEGARSPLKSDDSDTHIEYFGWYHDTPNETQPFSNLNIKVAASEAVAQMQQTGHPSLLDAYIALWKRNETNKHLYLRPDFKDTIAALAAVARPLLANKTIIGFNLGDEMSWSCLPPTQLSAGAAELRSHFPRGSAIIWYNEASGPLDPTSRWRVSRPWGKANCPEIRDDYKIPAALDWFSVDIYRSLSSSDSRWVTSAVRSFYVSEGLQQSHSLRIHTVSICMAYSYREGCSENADDRISSSFPT
jgi:hypothetical protein